MKEKKVLKASEVEVVLKELLDCEKKQREYIDKLPTDISSVFYDNQITAALGRQISALIKFSFGELSEDVQYFLYEKTPQAIYYSLNQETIEYTITSLNDYIQYLIETGQIIEDRTT